MILFEATTSVFELMWDIALALFIIRISFAYFILTFLTGCLITYFRISSLQPLNHLTQPQAELFCLPFYLLSSTLWARYVIVAYEIPRVAGFRVAIGALACVFMMMAEVISGVVMYRRGWATWVWETDPQAAGAGAVVLLLFALMPRLLMVLELELDEMGDTYHGHEKKPITAAVPTVEKAKKMSRERDL